MDDTASATNRIVSKQIEFGTPWFELISKRVTGESQPYYSLRMADYVSVVAFTAQNELILIRQYRPAVEGYTLELPSGHVEKNEAPEEAATRELAEESGFCAAKLEPLGTLVSDAGRHENRLWCYYAATAIPAATNKIPEPGLQCVLVPRTELPELLASGEFNHAIDLAVLMLAAVRRGPQLLGLT